MFSLAVELGTSSFPLFARAAERSSLAEGWDSKRTKKVISGGLYNRECRLSEKNALAANARNGLVQ